MNLLLTRMTVLVFAALYAVGVNAAFVDIDGLTGTPENAVTVNLLETDTLVVTPIGIVDGRAYDAFSFFDFTDGCNASGSSCQYGYTWFLGFYVDGDPLSEGTFFSPASLNAARDYFIFQ
jgi:hypothetical protein